MSTSIPLEDVRIASPCHADWNLMEGDDRTRFCQTCTKNVYNVAFMSREDAESLIREKEGDVCLRLYRRADGTIITDNCPVGIKVVRRPLKWLMAGFAALVASGAAIWNNNASASTSETVVCEKPVLNLREVQPFKAMMAWIDPTTQTTAPPIAGGIMPMLPAPTPKPTPKPTPTPRSRS